MSVHPVHILFIDDDEDDGELLQESMQQINPALRFLQVPDGWDAIMMLQKLANDQLPALIVLDINMRIINGFEFLKLMKSEERYKRIPMMVYSTSIAERDKELSFQLGAAEYFSKPPNHQDIHAIAQFFCEACMIANNN